MISAQQVRLPPRQKQMIPGQTPDSFIYAMLGKPPFRELANEYDMVRNRLMYGKSEKDFHLLLSGLKARADALEQIDRVFFLAYFSELFKDEHRRLVHGSSVQWKGLLDIAEKEARQGKRINSSQILRTTERISRGKGKVCNHTSPEFVKAFLFRNAYRISVELPEKEPFVSAPAKEPLLIVPLAANLIEITGKELQLLAGKINRFIWWEESLQRDFKNNYFRDRDVNNYWDVFHGAHGERYTVKLGRETICIYKCLKQVAYMKGMSVNGLPYYANTEEFNLYSPTNNSFYFAQMEDGEIVGTCRSKMEPSPELASLFRQVSMRARGEPI